VDWLELSYATPVYATQVVIYQTYNPSQVVKVELIDAGGNAHEVYTAQPAEQTCPFTLTISVTKTDYKVSKIRITVDQTVLGGWNEIDAVQLIGYDR
jgi:predicted aspartyl protease